VENHTATHPPYFACLPPGRLRAEIVGAQSLLADITGIAPSYFRAPMGFRSPFLDPVLALSPLVFASWTRRAFDGVLTDPARAYRRLTLGLSAGDILLMHDGRAATAPSGRKMVLEVLPRLLDALRAQGLMSIKLTAKNVLF
jgi:peptidoglycan/xylan/chitin deacetylase (PgdA/CDA1 family)